MDTKQNETLELLQKLPSYLILIAPKLAILLILGTMLLSIALIVDLIAEGKYIKPTSLYENIEIIRNKQ